MLKGRVVALLEVISNHFYFLHSSAQASLGDLQVKGTSKYLSTHLGVCH